VTINLKRFTIDQFGGIIGHVLNDPEPAAA